MDNRNAEEVIKRIC